MFMKTEGKSKDTQQQHYKGDLGSLSQGLLPVGNYVKSDINYSNAT